jgi:hypothetical protein
MVLVRLFNLLFILEADDPETNSLDSPNSNKNVARIGIIVAASGAPIEGLQGGALFKGSMSRRQNGVRKGFGGRFLFPAPF